MAQFFLEGFTLLSRRPIVGPSSVSWPPPTALVLTQALAPAPAPALPQPAAAPLAPAARPEVETLQAPGAPWRGAGGLQGLLEVILRVSPPLLSSPAV